MTETSPADPTGRPRCRPHPRFAASLRLRLVALVMLAAIPALALALYTGVEQRALAATDAKQTALRLARIASAEQQRIVEDTERLLRTLARVTPVADGELAACNTLYRSLLLENPQYTNLAVANRAGDFLCSGTPMNGPVNVADRKYFQRGMATRQFSLGDYVIGRVSGKATLLTGLPVLDDGGEVRLIYHAGIDLTWLNRFAAEADLPPGARLAVVDRDGLVLVRYPDPQSWVGQSVRSVVPPSSDSGAPDGVGESVDEEGTLRLFAFAPLGAAGQTDQVYLSIGTPSAVAYADADAIVRRNLVALGLVTLAALLAAWFGTDLVLLRRIRALAAAASRVERGDTAVRTGATGGGELAELARAFDSMATAIEERRRQRDQAERERDRLLLDVDRERATLAAVMESMSQGLILVDSGWTCRYSNTIAERMLDLPAGFLNERSVAESFSAVRAASPADSLLDALLASRTGDGGPNFVFRPAGRTSRDLLFEVFPVRDEAGEDRGAGMLLRDVTAELDLVRTKDELVAVVSHELRTPLAAVVGFAELLLARELNTEQRRTYLNVIVQEGGRLTGLINDLLDIQRMDGEGVELDREPTDLAALLQQAVDATPDDSARPITLTTEAPPATVDVDPLRIRQVLTNLISNARKYSPAGGPVRLALRRLDGAVEIAVADEGLGLPPEELPRIFEKFHRVDNSDRRSIKGVGLGLAICRRIVEAHGGVIRAESAGLGRGSCFRFTLPIPAADAAAASVAPEPAGASAG